MEHIKINGQVVELKGPLTIQQLLMELDYSPDTVAVAINFACIPRSDFMSQQLQANDQVEILSAIQGG